MLLYLQRALHKRSTKSFFAESYPSWVFANLLGATYSWQMPTQVYASASGRKRQDFTSISFTTCLTLGIVFANLPASLFCAGVLTLPLRTSVPFFAL